MLRYLRIAGSIICLIAAVLLIALWVRSYWRMDLVQGPCALRDGFSVTSVRGRLMFSAWLTDEDPPVSQWELVSMDPRRWSELSPFPGPAFALGFSSTDTSYFDAPHWFLALVGGLMAIALAVKRFGLRTFLIAVVLLAAVLGLAAQFRSTPPVLHPTNPDINRPITNETIVGQPRTWQPVRGVLGARLRLDPSHPSRDRRDKPAG